MSWIRTIAAVLFVGGALLAGILGGVWLQEKRGLYDRISVVVKNNRFSSVVYRAASGLLEGGAVPEIQRVQWREVETNLHRLQVAAVKVSNVTIRGGSIAAMGGNVVMASTHGRLSYLDVDNRLHPLDVRVPMNMEALRSDPLYEDPLFNVTFVRTLDLLVVPTGAETYDLYASFSRFAADCFEFVVSRISFETNGRVLSPSGEWRDLWIADPCVPLKEQATPFVGEEAGGRMVRYGADKILVAVGDHQLDGFYDRRSVAMDSAFDLGKLMEVDIHTGESRQFAAGLRNPQGLTVSRDGRIWETEHGPQGGDEVNLMIEGREYGWPVVTYGMAYGSPRKNWPANPQRGRHEGYEPPRFAFVPSIGIGSIVEPDDQEFPNWDGTLLLCALGSRTLYLLRREGDQITYAEPLLADDYRLRDITVLDDGRLAILTDFGSLLFVRNAERHQSESSALEVSGFPTLPPPLPDEAPSVDGLTPADRGRQYFLGTCSSCHSLSGEVGTGPPLNGVIGRRIASAPGFGYSPALTQYQDERWTESSIISYSNNPNAFAPGTSMQNTGIYWAQMRDIAAFLEGTR